MTLIGEPKLKLYGDIIKPPSPNYEFMLMIPWHPLIFFKPGAHA